MGNICKRLALSFIGNLDNFQNHKGNNRHAYASIVYIQICNINWRGLLLLLVIRQSRASDEVIANSSHASSLQTVLLGIWDINKIFMVRKIHLLFVILFFMTFNSNSQNIFDLKGKNIILTTDKISYDYDYSRSRYSCHNDFGNIYNVKSLKKNKFNKKNLYNGNIVGQTLSVEDVYYINKDKAHKKAILILLNTHPDTLVLHLPLYLEDAGYYGETVDPKEIKICYYDCDTINQFKEQMKNKSFYFNGGNNLVTIDSIYFDNNLLCICYEENRWITHITPNYTFRYKYSRENYYPLNEFISSIIFEDDLIAKCKQQHDTLYIEKIKDKFLNKEIHFSNDRASGFYEFSNVEIKNIGEREPLYDYIITLKNEKSEIYLPVEKGMHITLADEYREEQRIKEEQRKKKEAEYKAKIEKEKREYEASLINKYGKEKALLILDGKVRLGFTKEMCLESWGKPYAINRTVTSYGTDEQWVYGLWCYLYFEDGILTAIQD